MTTPHSRSALPWKRFVPWILGGFLLVLVVSLLATWRPDRQAVAQDDPKRVKAPELDGGTDWINTGGPLKLADLKGKVVVLDFWTYCCINCIHMLPDLTKLEEKYEKELVVIGVHSPKFDNEKLTENIRKAVLRYQIKHPVVNDADQKIWNRYGVSGWPTVCVIDPEGYAVYIDSGEGQYKILDKIIGRLIEIHKKKKTLDEKPLRFDTAKFRDKTDSPLFFPGKVLADAATNRLFIADSTNHRLVVTDLTGKHLFTVGGSTGEPGYKEGTFTEARFDDPQGLALKGDSLFVADRKNHVIREVNLKDKTVKTVAGIGKQVRSNRQSGGDALQTGMNSPWDLLWVNDKLFIAMAGHHQIWTLDLANQKLVPYAGDGGENIVDGPLMESRFAQPSGLTTDGKQLFVADSETSSIRALPLDGKGEVKTLVGRGLFKFGDIDGTGDAVRLQHALSVLAHDDQLIVADTYNSKLKVLDPKTRECKTWLATSETGKERLFNEPAGLSFAHGKLYVADTNAHRIQVVDWKTKTVETLKLTGVPPIQAVK